MWFAIALVAAIGGTAFFTDKTLSWIPDRFGIFVTGVLLLAILPPVLAGVAIPGQVADMLIGSFVILAFVPLCVCATMVQDRDSAFGETIFFGALATCIAFVIGLIVWLGYRYAYTGDLGWKKPSNNPILADEFAIPRDVLTAATQSDGSILTSLTNPYVEEAIRTSVAIGASMGVGIGAVTVLFAAMWRDEDDASDD